MDKRLNHIETELRGLREEFMVFRKSVDEKFESLRKEIDERLERFRKEISERFYWLIGILLTMWITIILAIIRLRS
jgi:hypothetical protein